MVVCTPDIGPAVSQVTRHICRDQIFSRRTPIINSVPDIEICNFRGGAVQPIGAAVVASGSPGCKVNGKDGRKSAMTSGFLTAAFRLLPPRTRLSGLSGNIAIVEPIERVLAMTAYRPRNHWLERPVSCRVPTGRFDAFWVESGRNLAPAHHCPQCVCSGGAKRISSTRSLPLTYASCPGGISKKSPGVIVVSFPLSTILTTNVPDSE